MAIEDIQWASNDQITLTKQDGMVKDITNDVDNIHKQYLMGTSAASGFIHFSEPNSALPVNMFVHFFHHTDFTTNYRVIWRYQASINNTLTFAIKSEDGLTTEQTVISSQAYTSANISVFKSDFTFSKATANYQLDFTSATNLAPTGGNDFTVSSFNLIALPKF